MCQHPAHIRISAGAFTLRGCDCAIISAAPGAPVVYSYDMLVAHFREHDGMSEEAAIEWIGYNCALPHLGAAAPRIIDGEGRDCT